MRSEKGFYVMELIIVMVIVGVLAAIIIPNAIAIHDRFPDARTRANMKAVQMAALDYSIQDNGHYPQSVADVIGCLPGRKMLMNAHTHQLTEPSNGHEPCSVLYTFWQDQVGEEHFKVNCCNAKGVVLRYELSDQ